MDKDNLIIKILIVLIVFGVIFIVYPNRKYRYIAIKDTFQEKLLRLFVVAIVMGWAVVVGMEYPINLLIFYLFYIVPFIMKYKMFMYVNFTEEFDRGTWGWRSILTVLFPYVVVFWPLPKQNRYLAKHLKTRAHRINIINNIFKYKKEIKSDWDSFKYFTENLNNINLELISKTLKNDSNNFVPLFNLMRFNHTKLHPKKDVSYYKSEYTGNDKTNTETILEEEISVIGDTSCILSGDRQAKISQLLFNESLFFSGYKYIGKIRPDDLWKWHYESDIRYNNFKNLIIDSLKDYNPYSKEKILLKKNTKNEVDTVYETVYEDKIIIKDSDLKNKLENFLRTHRIEKPTSLPSSSKTKEDKVCGLNIFDAKNMISSARSKERGTNISFSYGEWKSRNDENTKKFEYVLINDAIILFNTTFPFKINQGISSDKNFVLCPIEIFNLSKIRVYAWEEVEQFDAKGNFKAPKTATKNSQVWEYHNADGSRDKRRRENKLYYNCSIFTIIIEGEKIEYMIDLKDWSIKEKISNGQIELFDYTEEEVKKFNDAITSGLKNKAGVEEKYSNSSEESTEQEKEPENYTAAVELPKMKVPVFEAILPSTETVIKYRPLLVKEKKILSTARESEDVKTIFDAYKQIINNCVQVDLDVERLPTFDIEYIILQLRAKSIGEEVKIGLKPWGCPQNNGELCEFTTEVAINLEEVKVQKTENHTNKIMLSDNIGIILNYPNIESLKETMNGELSETDIGMKVIKNSVEMIFSQEETHERGTFTEKELDDFIDNLNALQMEKINDFFESMPTLKHTVKYKCLTCGEDKETTVQGLNSFFGETTETTDIYEGEYKEGGNDITVKHLNDIFLSENNLTILPNGNIRDENFEEYELEEERVDFIVYKPEGMRGKRAYIKTDGENYLAWSGPIKIADKSKFLRGDFEKAKEESQPIEEAPAQEQEVEKIEVKQEKESETSDATSDIGSMLEKLTKLYEEGKLTEEEFKKKSDDLVSQI